MEIGKIKISWTHFLKWLTIFETFVIEMVRRISSIFDGSRLADRGGYWGSPSAFNLGSIVVID